MSAGDHEDIMMRTRYVVAGAVVLALLAVAGFAWIGRDDPERSGHGEFATRFQPVAPARTDERAAGVGSVRELQPVPIDRR
jgi:hypothetical protein